MKFIDSFRIYLDKTDQWINVIQTPDDRSNFNACSFMKNIYVFGGFIDENKICLKSCYKYDIKKSKWKIIAKMNEYRENAACTVFKGKIVLTGGDDSVNRVRLSSVETYDYYENKWDFLPRMINKRCFHGAVCMGNKLFVIGGWKNSTCEVFDSSSMKFTSIKQLKTKSLEIASAVSLGDKILVFCSGDERQILTYIVDNNEWYFQSNRSFDSGEFVCLTKLSVI